MNWKFAHNHRNSVRRCLTALFLAAMALTLPIGVPLAAHDARARICESRCTERFWSCRNRAFAISGRRGDRALAICDTTFYGCMNRCAQYAQSKRK